MRISESAWSWTAELRKNSWTCGRVGSGQVGWGKREGDTDPGLELFVIPGGRIAMVCPECHFDEALEGEVSEEDVFCDVDSITNKYIYTLATLNFNVSNIFRTFDRIF